MALRNQILRYLNQGSDFDLESHCRLGVDDKGDEETEVIEHWDEASLGPKPSVGQLAVLDGTDLPPALSMRMQVTEEIGVLARKLEEVMEAIHSGSPLSPQSLAWLADRRKKRAQM